jgi:hypothetical protein
MAAILAAWQVVNRPVAIVGADGEGRVSPAWRFSGRWWARPVAVRRYRPWT